MRCLTIFTLALLLMQSRPAPAQTLEVKRPLIPAALGPENEDEPSPSVVASNTDAIQTAVNQALQAGAGYPLVIPVGRYYTNALTTPVKRGGGQIWGAGGLGQFDDDNHTLRGSKTALVHGDAAQYTAPSAHDVDNLKQPLLKLNSSGALIGGINFFGRDPNFPDTTWSSDTPQADVGIQIPTRGGGVSPGKHTIFPCTYRNFNRAIYFGELDGSQGDNSDTTALVGFHRFQHCWACVTLNNHQTQPLTIDFLQNVFSRISIDLRYGGHVKANMLAHNASGGIALNLGPADKSPPGSSGINNPMVNLGCVQFDPPNGNLPTMVVNAELDANSRPSFYSVKIEQLSLGGQALGWSGRARTGGSNQGEVNGGIDNDGGPCFSMAGAQKCHIENMTGAYLCMFEGRSGPGFGSDRVPYYRLDSYSVGTAQNIDFNGRNLTPALLVHPAAEDTSSDADGCVLDVGRQFAFFGNVAPFSNSGFGDSFDRDSLGINARSHGVRISHHGGYQYEEWEDGEVIWRFGQVVTSDSGDDGDSDRDEPLAVTTYTLWTSVPSDFDGWTVESVAAKTFREPLDGGFTMNVLNDSGAEILNTDMSFSTDQSREASDDVNGSNNTLSAGDSLDVSVDTMTSTANNEPLGLVVWLELAEP